MKPSSPDPQAALTFFKGLGLAYKAGLVVSAAGVLLILCSEIFGGLFYQVVLGLLELQGAPADREFLPPDNPGAGPRLLQFAGSLILVCGICVVSVRLVIGLLGLTSGPELTDKLGQVDKAGLGVAVFGVLLTFSGAIPEVLLYELSRPEFSPTGLMSTLSIVARVGSLFLLCGLLIVAVGGPRRREVFLGWTEKYGWGKSGHAWANKTAIGLFVLAVIISMIGMEEVGTYLGGAGIVLFLVGIAVNFFSGTNP